MASLGEKLSRGRLARGLPVEEVARQMNLSASTIRALEADNHRGLPGRTFVRGYLRNYSRVIGVPAEELVKAYDAQFAEEEEPVAFLAPQRRAIRWLGPVIIATGVAVLAAVLWGAVSLVIKHWFTVAETAQSIAQPVISTVTRSESPAQESIPAPLEPLASPVKETLPPETVVPSGAIATQDSPVPPETTPSPAPSPAPEAPAVTPEPSAAQAPAPTAGQPTDGLKRGALAFAFSADCWIRVRDATGSNLYRGMMRGGTTLALEGVPPFKVVVGNRSAVSLTYNGQPVAINGDASNPVVTLNLGSP